MNKHRNSQKRFYNERYTYFVTGVTKNRHPYFEEEIFCRVFKEKLELCSKLKEFQLHGWFLGYDHFHLLLTPMGDQQFIYFEGEVSRPRLQRVKNVVFQPTIDLHFSKLKSLQQRFHKKHPNPTLSPSKFQWQKSFHDHVIRDEKDHETHLRYIEYNPLKHNMPEGWTWWATSFVSDVVGGLEF